MNKNFYRGILFLTMVFMLGCASLMGRKSMAEDIAGKAGFSIEYIKAGSFTLMTYQKFHKQSDSINIYIEGDGRAWETKHELSLDPTPSNPLALKLASLDPADNIAYVARPGQYSASGIPDCDSKYWSNDRFAPEVIESMDKAIDILKEKSGAKYVSLIGYSGGGAIAVLVAARRSDIIAIRTVAGNLNTLAFCVYHHVSQLKGSINPLDAARVVAHIPQRHFVGSKDKIVPLAIVESFVKMEGDKDDGRIYLLDGVSHNDGWAKSWKDLLAVPLL